MNDEILKKCEEINKEILSLDVVKNYIFYKKTLQNSTNFSKFNNELQYYRYCEGNNNSVQFNQKTYKQIINDPFVSNYLNSEREFYEFLDEVKNTIL